MSTILPDEPEYIEGYRHNPLPNRAQRRAQAKAHNRNAWGKANKDWSELNVQTSKPRRKKRKR